MIKNVAAITLASYLAMLFLGVGNSLVGGAARNIGLSPFQIGLLIAIQNIGFMVSVLLSGTLADRHEKPRLLFVGSLILSASFLAFYRSDVFWINLIVMLFIGAGIGAYEGVTDVMLLDMHAGRAGFHISINHLFVTIGSALITVYLIFLEMNWRAAIVQSGIVVLLLAAFFAFAKLGVKQRPSGDSSINFRALLQNRTLTILFLLTILAVGVEIGTLGILTTYLMELRQFTQLTSKIGLIVFLAGIATGRLVIGLLTREDKIRQYLLTLFGCAALIFLGLYFLDLGSAMYLLIFLAGITISAVFPLIITLAGLQFKDHAGTAIGVIKVAVPIGGILIPFGMSLIAQIDRLQTSLLIFPLAFLLALGLTAFGLRGIHSARNAAASEK